VKNLFTNRAKMPFPRVTLHSVATLVRCQKAGRNAALSRNAVLRAWTPRAVGVRTKQRWCKGLLEKQRDLATNTPQQKRAAEAQLATARGNQAEFRAEAALNRERDTRIAKGDFKGTQAVTDFIDLKKLTGQFAANGPSPAQAQSDFEKWSPRAGETAGRSHRGR
jgi:hypothetical protein